MKKIKITAAVIAATMTLGTTAFALNQPVMEEGYVYAFGENWNNVLLRAADYGIVENTDGISNADITREQFCEYAYNALNSIKELPMAKLAENPFNDVMNSKINQLAFVGIIGGKGDHIFAPNDKITREEAAVILHRMAKYAEIELPAVKVDIEYADNGDISDWALPSVAALRVSGIVSESDGEKFNPDANYTVEETITSLVKLCEAAKK